MAKKYWIQFGSNLDGWRRLGKSWGAGKKWRWSFRKVPGGELMSVQLQFNQKFDYIQKQHTIKYKQMDTNYEPQEESVEVAGFIAKTFEILNNQDFSRIIYWSPAGTEFIIKDINKFQQVVLPKYFRHNKINSFIRQLNMYGFHKSRKEHSKSVFSHPLFLKDREDLLCEIKRKIKNNEDDEQEKFETPVKSQKVVKEDLETAVTGKELPAKSEKMMTSMNSIKQLTLLQGVGSSFIKLFESNGNFVSKPQFNFSLNRISANCIDEVNHEFEDFKDDEIISIEAGIEEKQEREQEMQYITSIAKFQNPSCFFNSFIERN